MLTQIHIRNLAIVDEIDVELAAGLTALTGETGAGKSILIDALGLVLGDRADNTFIRHGCERAEIAAAFELSNNPAAAGWLQEQALDLDNDCQLRRIINREGRSRGFINGQPVPMQSLRELGERLVAIHGQHEHQSLTRSAVQRQLLDAFGGHLDLLGEVAMLYGEWRNVQAELDSAIRDDTDREARLDLLRFQLQELDALDLGTEAIRTLDEEHARQANAGQLLAACQAGLERLDTDEGTSACTLINQTLNDLTDLTRLDSGLEEPARLLSEAAILVREGSATLRQYAERLEIDPQRLQWLDERIGVLHALARKHRCTVEELAATREQISRELDAIEQADRRRETLQERLDELAQAYRAAACRLTGKRKAAAGKFSKLVTASMQTLGMAGGRFEAAVSGGTDEHFGPQGMDAIEFLVSANRGQPLQPLSKVASGGELSRISLSIQVISAGSDRIPTLIFDEVDSGIGGGVAEIVGRQLRILGADRQVLCVTHLPQVAALANHQLQVSKLSGEDSTRTRIRVLAGEERIDEIARMLGGMTITARTRAHAREMLEQEPQSNAPRARSQRRGAKQG
ncbi:MAG: DNA repair protein RecN [Gammaproteobacteria bacterium]|jgi:DNA repair protein RecN (Recombination protein N)